MLKLHAPWRDSIRSERVDPAIAFPVRVLTMEIPSMKPVATNAEIYWIRRVGLELARPRLCAAMAGGKASRSSRRPGFKALSRQASRLLRDALLASNF